MGRGLGRGEEKERERGGGGGGDMEKDLERRLKKDYLMNEIDNGELEKDRRADIQTKIKIKQEKTDWQTLRKQQQSQAERDKQAAIQTILKSQTGGESDNIKGRKRQTGRHSGRMI